MSDDTLTAGVRRLSLLVQREAAHRVILEALSAGDSDFLRKYHWDMPIDKVIRIAGSSAATIVPTVAYRREIGSLTTRYRSSSLPAQ